MNDDQLVEAYTGGGAGLPGLRAVELAATADLTAQLQAAQATIAEAQRLVPIDTAAAYDVLSRADTSTHDAAIRAAKAEGIREGADAIRSYRGYETSVWLRRYANAIESPHSVELVAGVAYNETAPEVIVARARAASIEQTEGK